MNVSLFVYNDILKEIASALTNLPVYNIGNSHQVSNN